MLPCHRDGPSSSSALSKQEETGHCSNALFPLPWLVLLWIHKATWRFGNVSDPFCTWDLRDSFAAGSSARASLPSTSGWTLSSYSLFWNSKWVTFLRSHRKRIAEKKAALFTPVPADLSTLSTVLQPQHCVCLLVSKQGRVKAQGASHGPSSVGLCHCYRPLYYRFSSCCIKYCTCGRLTYNKSASVIVKKLRITVWNEQRVLTKKERYFKVITL